MRRQDKYPDTGTFHWYNANPKNKFTGDCVYRAVATALEKSWQEVVMELAQMAIDTGYSPSSVECMDRYLKKHGWIKCKQPRKEDGRKYTAEEFCAGMFFGEFARLSRKRIVANIGGGHVAAIVNSKVQDIWDCTDGCVGNYWIKP